GQVKRGLRQGEDGENGRAGKGFDAATPEDILAGHLYITTRRRQSHQAGKQPRQGTRQGCEILISCNYNERAFSRYRNGCEQNLASCLLMVTRSKPWRRRSRGACAALTPIPEMRSVRERWDCWKR